MGPLDGLRVIDAGTLAAAPLVATYLGELGADVIKVEQPAGGDHLRRWGAQKDGVGLYWKSVGRGKRSVTLDLRSPRGQELFLELAKRSDAVLENFRPGTLERWNIGWETLHAANPDLVLLRISGFGQTGPYASKPGFGTLVEAMTLDEKLAQLIGVWVGASADGGEVAPHQNGNRTLVIVVIGVNRRVEGTAIDAIGGTVAGAADTEDSRLSS